MIDRFNEGYESYFEGTKYSATNNSAWMRGWTKAERESRCGWYDQYGEPNRERNKNFT